MDDLNNQYNVKEYTINVEKNKWKINWQDTYEKILLLFITGKCNLNCKNCFSSSSRNSIEMTLEQIKNILDANKELKKVYLFVFVFLLQLFKKRKIIGLRTFIFLLYNITCDFFKGEQVTS